MAITRGKVCRYWSEYSVYESGRPQRCVGQTPEIDAPKFKKLSQNWPLPLLITWLIVMKPTIALIESCSVAYVDITCSILYALFTLTAVINRFKCMTKLSLPKRECPLLLLVVVVCCCWYYQRKSVLCCCLLLLIAVVVITKERVSLLFLTAFLPPLLISWGENLNQIPQYMNHYAKLLLTEEEIH